MVALCIVVLTGTLSSATPVLHADKDGSGLAAIPEPRLIRVGSTVADAAPPVKGNVYVQS